LASYFDAVNHCVESFTQDTSGEEMRAALNAQIALFPSGSRGKIWSAWIEQAPPDWIEGLRSLDVI